MTKSIIGPPKIPPKGVKAHRGIEFVFFIVDRSFKSIARLFDAVPSAKLFFKEIVWHLEKLFFKEIVWLPGVSNSITFNCESKFLVHFWLTLWKISCASFNYRSTMHP